VSKAVAKKREEARELFLTEQSVSNAVIARHLGLKPHTVGRWRKEEDWDALALKIHRREAEKLVEQIATDRVSLNVKHYRLWELLLVEMSAVLHGKGKFPMKELIELAGLIEKAQKGQRLAKGLSLDGQTEEEARAEAQAENRYLIDVFIEAVKRHVTDPGMRDRLRETILELLPGEDENDDGAKKAS